MRVSLILLFGAIFVGMIAVNVWAGLQINLFDAWPDYKQNPWAIATLVDAYAGFVTFYVWLAWRERSQLSRILWFILVMGLGNISMAFYVLLQLFRLKAGDSPARLFERKAA